ncbi:hypothetical protein NQ314_014487 [Rhamnusium bicolor]|uniref:RETREG1-3/ARL6IP-like N-terminal reticulon-homology domain-containing protein n=1 Tax=Rhamnusium bicolor TaxID=1586634 RepID=A0AAV8X1C3_9CUCU|nr:hypothetical protein NQ314_014487 [Rhamnusium bicolor]
MEYLTKKLRYIANIFKSRDNENNREREVSRYEVYFEHVYKVLSWEDNTVTLVVFLVLNFIFWLIVQWQLRFYGIVFFTILLGFLWDSYFETKECTVYRGQYSEAVDDVYNYVCEIIFGLKALRKESPLSFCIMMFLIFLFICFIARNVSGYVVLYFTMLAIFYIPLGFKYLPEEYLTSFKQMMKSVGTSEGVLAEEELIPFIFNKDFSRKDTDLDSLLTDKTAESATNSLASGISAMPSYLDVTESQDGIEEDDLIPKIVTREVLYTPGELSSDSDSDHREIHFDSSHFNGDSSSEEENQLIKGLRFSIDAIDANQRGQTPAAGFSGVLSNFATLGSSLVSNVLKSAVSGAPVERKNSSSDSEFEIINSEEVDNS